MQVSQFIQPGDVIVRLKATTKMEALQEMAAHLARTHPGLDDADLVRHLVERERIGGTGVGEGVALPHCRQSGVSEMVGLLARSIEGVEFNAVDRRPVHLFFVLLAPAEDSQEYLKALARVSTLCRNQRFREAVMTAPPKTHPEELHRLIVETERG